MKNTITISWSIGDVQALNPNVTDKKARKVLEFLKHNHDASIGINWEVIDCAISYLFPDIPEGED